MLYGDYDELGKKINYSNSYIIYYSLLMHVKLTCPLGYPWLLIMG